MRDLVIRFKHRENEASTEIKKDDIEINFYERSSVKLTDDAFYFFKYAIGVFLKNYLLGEKVPEKNSIYKLVVKKLCTNPKTDADIYSARNSLTTVNRFLSGILRGNKYSKEKWICTRKGNIKFNAILIESIKEIYYDNYKLYPWEDTKTFEAFCQSEFDSVVKSDRIEIDESLLAPCRSEGELRESVMACINVSSPRTVNVICGAHDTGKTYSVMHLCKRLFTLENMIPLLIRLDDNADTDDFSILEFIRKKYCRFAQTIIEYDDFLDEFTNFVNYPDRRLMVIIDSQTGNVNPVITGELDYIWKMKKGLGKPCFVITTCSCSESDVGRFRIADCSPHMMLIESIEKENIISYFTKNNPSNPDYCEEKFKALLERIDIKWTPLLIKRFFNLYNGNNSLQTDLSTSNLLEFYVKRRLNCIFSAESNEKIKVFNEIVFPLVTILSVPYSKNHSLRLYRNNLLAAINDAFDFISRFSLEIAYDYCINPEIVSKADFIILLGLCSSNNFLLSKQCDGQQVYYEWMNESERNLFCSKGLKLLLDNDYLIYKSVLDLRVQKQEYHQILECYFDLFYDATRKFDSKWLKLMESLISNSDKVGDTDKVIKYFDCLCSGLSDNVIDFSEGKEYSLEDYLLIARCSSYVLHIPSITSYPSGEILTNQAWHFIMSALSCLYSKSPFTEAIIRKTEAKLSEIRVNRKVYDIYPEEILLGYDSLYASLKQEDFLEIEKQEQYLINSVELLSYFGQALLVASDFETEEKMINARLEVSFTNYFCSGFIRKLLKQKSEKQYNVFWSEGVVINRYKNCKCKELSLKYLNFVYKKIEDVYQKMICQAYINRVKLELLSIKHECHDKVDSLEINQLLDSEKEIIDCYIKNGMFDELRRVYKVFESASGLIKSSSEVSPSFENIKDTLEEYAKNFCWQKEFLIVDSLE